MTYATIKAYTGYTIACIACDFGHEGIGGNLECSREEALRALHAHNKGQWHRENMRQQRAARAREQE